MKRRYIVLITYLSLLLLLVACEDPMEFNNYRLDISKEGEGWVGIEPVKSHYVEGEEITLTAITPESGWIFVGWSGDLSGREEIKSFKINKDMKVKATFSSGLVIEEIEAKTVEEGERISFTVQAIAPGERELTYSAQGNLADYFDAQTQEFSWTPGSGDGGTHELIIIVSDGEEEAEERVEIGVYGIVLRDHFGISRQNWSTNSSSTVERSYSNSRYQIKLKDSNWLAWSYPPDVDSGLNRYKVESEMSLASASGEYGYIFNFEDIDNYYILTVIDEQELRISQKKNGNWERIVDQDVSPYVNSGQKNKVKLVQDNSQVSCIINSQQVAQISIIPASNSMMGLLAGSRQSVPGTVQFHSFELLKLP